MIPSVTTDENSLTQALGALLHFEETSQGIEAETSYGSFKILVYSANIIRLHITRNEKYDDHSYSVITGPDFDAFTVQDQLGSLIIKTSELYLKIMKAPVKFSFYNKSGVLINEDDFGTLWIGEQVTTYKKLQEGERFIGLGEKTGPLDRRGHGYQNWNTDHFGYPPESDPLYCSTPFYIGIHNGMSYGIFMDNSHKSHFNFGASNNRFSSFSADSGDMNYYFIYHDQAKDILTSYTHLTGRMELPPIWSIGYQQCRYSYYPDKEVLNLAHTFRDKDIPSDVIVLDIHYMDNYKIFTWDNKNFSDPKEMMLQLKSLGFHVVVMCDPGIKIEKGYEPYQDGKEQDIFLKYPDGEPYSGEVWPGWCHFPDFTNPKAREWWKTKFTAYTELGVDGFWNDMNEIATWGQMLPDLIEFDFDGNKTTSRKGRNIYGFQMARSTYEGAKALLKGKRPFVLTRAGFSGIQRYAAVWTGDNTASDEHMLLGVRLINSMGLAGIAFSGYDVGGFVDNASESLFARWIQIGAFSPFFRGHSNINTRDSEPWAYGEEVEEISRNYIKLRYKLLPYIYSTFYEATLNGLPIARSLALDYTHDPNIYNHQYHNQYLFGPSFLIAPVESTKSLAKVYLPVGEWFGFFTDEKLTGPAEIVAECPIERLPIFVKGSSIIPLSPGVGNNTTQLGDTLEIHIYAGNEVNTFDYYEDDGGSYDFQKGQYFKRRIEYTPDRSSIVLSKSEGKRTSNFTKLKFCLHGFNCTLFKINGKTRPLETSDYRFIQPISNFDPIYDNPNTDLKIENLKTLTIDNSQSIIKLTW